MIEGGKGNFFFFTNNFETVLTLSLPHRVPCAAAVMRDLLMTPTLHHRVVHRSDWTQRNGVMEYQQVEFIDIDRNVKKRG